jgi:hypothetical protein
MYYCKSNRADVQKEANHSFGETSSILSARWKALSKEERQVRQKAKSDKGL